jgi:hypothetical protein
MGLPRVTDMRGMNYSLMRLLIAVLLVALSLAALQSDSAVVSGLVFTIVLGLLCLAIVGAASRRGRGRVFWLSFAVFGWGYLFAAFGIGSPQSPLRFYNRPELVTSHLLDLYARLRTPYRVGSKVVAQWRGGGYYPGVIRQVKDGQYLVAWDDGDTPLFVSPYQIQGSTDNYQRTGHALFCPLVAWLGALLAVWMFAEREPASAPGPPE